MLPDPGWKPVLRTLPRTAIPIPGIAPRPSGLTFVVRLRVVYATFVLAIYFLLPFVIAFIVTDWETINWAIGGGLVIGGAAAPTAAHVITSRRPQGTQPLDVVVALRTDMFLRLALAEAVPLAGFAFTFVTNSAAHYVIGAVVAIPAFLLAAPTVGCVQAYGERAEDPMGFAEVMFGSPTAE